MNRTYQVNRKSYGFHFIAGCFSLFYSSQRRFLPYFSDLFSNYRMAVHKKKQQGLSLGSLNLPRLSGIRLSARHYRRRFLTALSSTFGCKLLATGNRGDVYSGYRTLMRPVSSGKNRDFIRPVHVLVRGRDKRASRRVSSLPVIRGKRTVFREARRLGPPDSLDPSRPLKSLFLSRK